MSCCRGHTTKRMDHHCPKDLPSRQGQELRLVIPRAVPKQIGGLMPESATGITTSWLHQSSELGGFLLVDFRVTKGLRDWRGNALIL
ncbi:MAG: hypothetical protein ACE5I5_00480 [Candidatus Heimdallarchaeota archaeon]